MNWKELLSKKRWGPEDSAVAGDLRSEFGKDYHRIIESAPFRRLQDKTQVFPLDKSDFIRTRLTHSLEVSSIGRSLAQNIGSSILKTGLDPAFTFKDREEMCEVLECAGLIHDIGNPPFGHFGEEAIREWFEIHLSELTYLGRPVTDYLTDQQIGDFRHFEGNAQGLRLVSRLQFPVDENGMNLTAALMSAMLKYPNASDRTDPASSDVALHKMGYMTSESALYSFIQAETGTRNRRSPMTFILEAADDIAYATADIEDAFKKGFFGYEVFLREMDARGVRREDLKRLKDHYDFARLTRSTEPEEYALRKWLTEMQDQLIVYATENFLTHYESVMNGSEKRELLSYGAGRRLLSALKTTAYDYAFTSASIYKTEIAANTILTYLLNTLVPSALIYDSQEKPGLMQEKYISLISGNYRQLYHRLTEKKTDSEKVYYRLLLATDSISGMTDSHARDLYRTLTGFTTLYE